MSRALIAGFIASLVGFVNGVAICQAGGISLNFNVEHVDKTNAFLPAEKSRLIEAIRDDQTETTQASIKTWAEGVVYGRVASNATPTYGNGTPIYGAPPPKEKKGGGWFGGMFWEVPSNRGGGGSLATGRRSTGSTRRLGSEARAVAGLSSVLSAKPSMQP